MYDIPKLIDMSAWTGRWPFIHLRFGELAALEKKLKSVNITKAFVAPIEAILEQDPTRANMELLAEVKNDFFSPVPVIDLSYANWDECFDKATADKRVKMVKIVPNYHQYKLNELDMAPFIERVQKRGLAVSVQMKVEDPRAQYTPLNISIVPREEAEAMLAKFPGQRFIFHNIALWDAPALLKASENACVCIETVETQDTLAAVARSCPMDRVLFASHCAFFFPEGNINKLKYAKTDFETVEKVAYKNAERIFGL